MGSPPGLTAKPSVARYTDSVRQPRIQLRIIRKRRAAVGREILPRTRSVAPGPGCRCSGLTPSIDWLLDNVGPHALASRDLYDGWTPTRQSVRHLIDFAAGRIDADE